METYKIFVNGNEQGSIKCDDIEEFISETYPSVKYQFSHENKNVFLKADILDVMRMAMKN